MKNAHYLKMREPFLKENLIDCRAMRGRTETEHSGGAGRKRGVGKMNSRPALAFPAAGFRASEAGAPPYLHSQHLYYFTLFYFLLLCIYQVLNQI